MSKNNPGPESTFDDFPWLTAQDVQLLYSIVERAETSAERPFRALFAAYDQVLTENGISQAHDQKYLRFLLRMGEQRKSVGGGLFEQFRALLSKLNIQVDFDAERASNADAVMKEMESEETLAESGEGNAARVPGVPSRRASFESGYDVFGDKPPAQQVELEERPRSTGPGELSRPAIAPATKKQRLTQPSQSQKRKVSFSEVQNGPKAQVTRLSEEDTDVTSSRSDADDEYETSDYEYTQEITLPPKQGFRREDEDDEQQELEMNDRAKMLRYHHLTARAVRIFRDWRQSAEASNRLHSHMEASAIAKDTSTLKRQAFDHWHVELRAKMHKKETEKFFEGLEKRANAARDMFLLSKAFTHWAQCTEDEIMRTSAARRHILRTRFFNAWRDITVVNELKIRRMRLSKIMDLWKRRTAKTIHQQELAKSHYTMQVANTAYRNWFWSFCERRAPFWYESRQKQGVFNRWLDATRQNRVRASIAESYRQTGSTQAALTVWSNRSTVVQRQLSEAEAFRGRRLLLPNVETLRKELQLVPLHGKVHRNVVSRIVRDSLKVWYEKTATCVRAKRIDELRVMRNAWTAWNDHLRCQALQRAIDERVAVQALYKWVIASRLALFERVKRERSKQQVMSIWTEKSRKGHSALEHAIVNVETARNRRLAVSVLRYWRERSSAIREATQEAQRIHEVNVARAKFGSWVSRLQSFQRMKLCAGDAAFYVRAHTTIQKWRAASDASKKSKRRDAFAQMRQRVRVRTTQRVWQRWRDRAVIVKAAEQQAEQFSERHMQNSKFNCLALWHTRTADLAQALHEAQAYDTGRVLQNHFQLLVRRLGELQALNRQSAAFYADSTNESVASILRDVNWRLFRIKRQQETAASLLERNRRKHYRNMLRYWAQRTTRRRRVVEEEDDDDDNLLINLESPSRLSQPQNQPHRPQHHHHHHQQQLASSEFRPVPRFSRSAISFPARASTSASHQETGTSAAVTPGYLKTPLRRTARSASRVLSFPNTPATPQITPFMSRLQRSAQPAQSSEQRVHSARRDLARRLFASGRATLDIGPAIPEDASLADSFHISPLRRSNQNLTEHHPAGDDDRVNQIDDNDSLLLE